MRQLKDWNHDFLPALRLLRDAEQNVEAIPQNSSQPRQFRWIGRWLVSEAAVDGLFSARPEMRLLRQVLTADRQNILYAKLKSQFAGKLALFTQADCILFKTNLRAFYAPQCITIKIANPGRTNSELRIETEKTLRANLPGTTFISLPQLITVPKVLAKGVLVEELLDAKRINVHHINSLELAELLLDFHEVNGISYRVLSTVADLSATLKVFSVYCDAQGIRLKPATYQSLNDLLSHLNIGQQLVPCAICHGDLTVSNIMQMRHRFYIVDWEWAHEAPVFVDAVRLATQIPGFAADFLTAAGSKQQVEHTNVLDPRYQFAIAILWVACRRIARQHDFMSNRDQRAYQQRLKLKIRELVALLDRVLLEIRQGI